MYATLLGVMGSPQLTWSDEFADIVWRLHPATATPALRDRALSGKLSQKQRKLAIDTLAFITHERAAKAMIEAATKGPVDLRQYAAWWARHRSSNDWRSIEVARAFAGKPKQEDELPKKARFRSGLVRAGSIDIRVEIGDARTLWIVADDGGDGKSCDWADWIEPKLVGPEGEKLLTELHWTSATTDYGEIHKNKNCRGSPLRVGGIQYENGIGTHANSIIRYDFGKAGSTDIGGAGFTHFVARAGVDNGGPDIGGSDHGSKRSSVRFSVYVDGPGPAQIAAKHRKVLTNAKSSEEDKLRATDALLQTADGGHVLLDLAKKKQIPESVHDIVAEGIYRNPDLAVRALASKVFPRKNALPPIDELVKLEGDVVRGRVHFFSEAAKCGSCHNFGGVGKDVGPDLTKIREKFGQKQLIDAIINPSAAILSGYELKTIILKTGEAISGVVLAEGETVILKDAEGKKHEIARGKIAARQNQTVSIMPDGAGGLNAQELMDVIAFLRSTAKEN